MLHLNDLRGARKRAGGPGATPTDWRGRFAGLAASTHDARLRAYYARGAVAADRPLDTVPLVALDVETTGLDVRRDEIVSVGVVPMSLDCIRASASRHWVVKPRAELRAESVTLHAITHVRIAEAPDLEDILAELLEVLAGRVVVVHCRDIERRFLDGALRARLGEGISFPVIDTMELEARFQRGREPGLLARLLGRARAPASLRLADCRARYHLPRYRAHHALSDALATAELLQAQIAHRYTRATPVGELWC